jgi:GDSL-like lipase/acylhydrolase family protein
MNTPAGEGRLSLRAKRRLLALVAIGPSLLLLLAAEIYIRATTRHEDLWALTGRAVARQSIADWAFLDAFSALRGRPGVYHDGAVTKTVNSEGFISTPEITPIKPPHTIRIAFLGESSTAGTGTLLPDSVTWPWQVAENLRRRPGRTEKIEFINAALGGYSTFESMGRLWSRVRFFSPDIVVLYHGWNEMYYFKQVDRIADWRTLPDGSWGLEASVPVTLYQPRWYDWLVRYSQLLTKVRLHFSPAVNGEAGGGQLQTTLADHYDRRGLEIFRTNLRLIRSTAQTLGMELFVGKQATLIVPGLPASERARCRYDFHGFDHDAHVDAFNQIYRIVDQEIPADHVIDVTPLSGHPENFYDHIHPTDLGAARTAEIMADALAPAVAALEARHAREPR